MRRIFMILAAIAIVAAAYAENRILFVRMNDGKTDYFAFNEIDSIRYSNIDIDSVAYSGFKAQEIWLQDTVCRYRIEDIKELGFQTPEPVMDDNVIDLAGEIADYVVNAENVTVSLSLETPEKLLPKVGDRLFKEVPTEKIPNGFMGEVISVSTSNGCYVLECEYVTMEDIYTEYYGEQESYAEILPEESGAAKYAPSPSVRGKVNDFTYTHYLSPFRMEYTMEFGGESQEDIPVPEDEEMKWDVNRKLVASIDLLPSVTISRVTAIKDGNTEVQRTNIRINGDYTLGIAGKFKAEKRLDSDPVRLGTIPLGYGFVVSLDAYLFFEASVKMGLGYTYKNSLAANMEVTARKGWQGFSVPTGFRANMEAFHAGEHDVEFAFDGNLGAGIGFKPAIRWGEVSFISRIENKTKRERVSMLCLEPAIEAGLRLSGECMFTVKDLIDCDKSTSLYSRLANSTGLAIGPFLRAELYAGILESRFQIGDTWESDFAPWFQVSMVPRFSRPAFVDSGTGTASITYPVDGRTGLYKKIGIMVERDGEPEPTYYTYAKQYLGPEVSYREFKNDFPYTKGDKVTVSPFVEIMPGVKVKGYPAWPFADANFYPFISVQESGVYGIRAIGGALSTGSVTMEGVTVQEGFPFPFNHYEPIEEE